MNVENLSINFPEGYDAAKPIEIVVREGQAPQINEPQTLSKTVAITSVTPFVLFQEDWDKETQDKLRQHGVFVFSINPDNPSLAFYENPKNSRATVLYSVLEIDPDFAAFKINTESKFSAKDLEKLIRKQAHCFATQEIAKGLLSDLRNFEVKFEQVKVQEDNRQGVKKDSYEEAIKFTKGELPKQFQLNLPIWKHTKKQDLVLEIEIDRGPGNMPLYSFYSMDAELLKREVAEEVILGEIGKIKDNYATLEV